MLCYRSGKGWLVRNDTDLSMLRTLNGTLDQIGMQDNSYLRCLRLLAVQIVTDNTVLNWHCILIRDTFIFS